MHGIVQLKQPSQGPGQAGMLPNLDLSFRPVSNVMSELNLFTNGILQWSAGGDYL